MIIRSLDQLNLLSKKIADRLRIIGGYREELTKGSNKPKLYEEDIEYIADFKAFNKTYRQGGNILVKKGSYWLHTIPNKDSWKVYLNTEAGTFSYFNPDETKNVAEISVDTYDLIDEIEQLTIDFTEEDSSLFLRLRWDKTGLLVPIN